MSKLQFLLQEYAPLLSSIDESTQPLFGKMNVQQMVEHMSDSVQIANGKVLKVNTQPNELTEKMKAFMMSDRSFKDNTPNPEMPAIPLPLRNSTMEEAIEELQNELKVFENYFIQNPSITLTNPFFGDLNFAEWTHLLHKHATHHLRQFGVIVPTNA